MKNKKHRSGFDRVAFLKRVIVVLLLICLIAPSVMCVFILKTLNDSMSRLENELDELSETIRVMNENNFAYRNNRLSLDDTFVNEPIVWRERNSSEDGYGKQFEGRKVYLTFDDGPSSNTGRILDILKEYGVKATFFVVGKPDAVYSDVYRRIVNEGHTIGMHSYSHKYGSIYSSEESFKDDLEKIQNFIYDTTGVWSVYYRFPGGSSNSVSSVPMDKLISFLNEEDIIYYDWNVSSGDADSGYIPVQRIIDRSIAGVGRFPHEAVVLFHDADEKDTTVEALPAIIEAIQGMDNTEMLPITEDTMPLTHITLTGENEDMEG
ncbi:MAG: polysaccharide deacetylase [Lachnospiraceae bacterium]|nr:polysaccharide deacetylase [Lachnospiraceae bacterium]